MNNRNKKRNNLIPILSIILGILLIVCIGLFFTKDDDNKKKTSTQDETMVTVEDEESKEDSGDNSLEASIEIQTDYCKLYFPESWKEQIKVKISKEAGYKVQFYGLVEGHEPQHLFDVCFNSDEGMLLGYLENGDEVVNLSIDLMEFEFDESWKQEEIDQIYAMQEEMNFVMNTLSKNDNYVEP